MWSYTKEYAEAYRSRQGKYPPGYDPNAQEAAAKAACSHSSQEYLTEECPLYIINRALANCKTITSTERLCLGLLNSLMQKHGYAFVSNEQLALWLCMKSPDSVRNMLAKLVRMGFLRDTGRRNLEVR